MILLPSKEPLFASGEKRNGPFVVYYDIDGFPASCNFAPKEQFMKCCICGNACVQYHMDDDGSFTCSACGKFPREVLLQ